MGVLDHSRQQTTSLTCFPGREEGQERVSPSLTPDISSDVIMSKTRPPIFHPKKKGINFNTVSNETKSTADKNNNLMFKPQILWYHRGDETL